jgi:hypothetical protein
MPATYEPIATATASGSFDNLNFYNIPATYTDFRVVAVTRSSTLSDWRIRFNGDTTSSTSYSTTILRGDGTSATSSRTTNTNGITVGRIVNVATDTYSVTIIDVFNYAGSTNKRVLASSAGDLNGSGQVMRTVGLWRNTAAITAIELFHPGQNSFIGPVTLYGIKAA